MELSIHGDPAATPFVNHWVERRDKEVPDRFVVSTNQTPLTQTIVERVLERLEGWLGSPDRKPKGVTRIFKIDVGSLSNE